MIRLTVPEMSCGQASSDQSVTTKIGLPEQRTVGADHKRAFRVHFHWELYNKPRGRVRRQVKVSS
ncbi:hypothetical protein [Mesorhizobium sp. M0598]|uniref:hypothetical protein n=1 Tax=unclassified Mesorhizobium TaxID=325217 RepID=UPI003335C05F